MLIQHAAICVRRDADGDKVLLVTSMDTGRWIPPKGHPEPGLSGGEVAQAEALEEAGVIGNVTGYLGTYETVKRKKSGRVLPCLMHAWRIDVDDFLSDFPEMGLRQTRWLNPDEAADLVAEPGLKDILTSLEAEHVADAEP